MLRFRLQSYYAVRTWLLPLLLAGCFKLLHSAAAAGIGNRALKYDELWLRSKSCNIVLIGRYTSTPCHDARRGGIHHTDRFWHKIFHCDVLRRKVVRLSQFLKGPLPLLDIGLMGGFNDLEFHVLIIKF